MLGIPSLYFYLFGAWASLIFALAWVIERGGGRGPRQKMTQAPILLLIALGYVGLLFAIAYRYDREGAWPAGRPVAGSAIYAMSIAVYCTSWTYYGSVGRASVSGIDFVPIYLGPTLTFCLGWPLLAKSCA